MLSLFLHPIALYSAVWILVLTLYDLRILSFYQDLPEQFVILQIVSVLASIVITASSRSKRYAINSVDYIPSIFMALLERLLKKLELALSFVFLCEFFLSGGLPLLWILSGSSKKHIDFGIPTIHGIFHGLLLFFVTATTMCLFYNHNIRRNKFRLFFFFLYAISVFNRGIVVIALLQVLFLKLIVLKASNSLRISWQVAASSASLVFVLPYIFGLLGDLRQAFNPFLNSISPSWSVLKDPSYSPFLWFYAYSTGGVNNVVHILHNSTGLDLGFLTFNNLIPNAFYTLTGFTKPASALGLADDRLTVGTLFWGPLQDLGIAGVFLIIPVLFFATLAYQSARKGNHLGMFNYSIFCQSLIMSPYVDTILYLPFLLQLLTGNYIIRKFQRQSSPRELLFDINP